ncbi:helix-turn-helix transcriptional regulator [Halomicrobium urmianum]|uniref:helix-turn-helix transcriptional regulator n=1 Tax=Halomicrobium urmianum TaxID=1586233 RepID=UPI001CDA4243|nr:MarR family transcriptional regulator [Halomicrobium urmianum]
MITMQGPDDRWRSDDGREPGEPEPDGREADAERARDDDRPPPSSPVLEALLENARSRRHLGRRLEAAGARVDADLLGDVVRHGPALEALRAGPLDRREIEDRLDVSRATSHRLTRWLCERGYAEKADGRFRLTGTGEAVADEVLRFEANVGTVERLGPLLDAVCEDHQEFVVEPFVDATVTLAGPDDPYRPVDRFLALAAESETVRGFNTAPMAPTGAGEFHERVFDGGDVEVIYHPAAAERLVEAYPERAAAAAERGVLALRARADLPYGLAIFDDRVGIGGYDEATGLPHVFVDTDSPIAREWAERVYASVRDDSVLLGVDRPVDRE